MALFGRSFLVASIGIIETSGGIFPYFEGVRALKICRNYPIFTRSAHSFHIRSAHSNFPFCSYHAITLTFPHSNYHPKYLNTNSNFTLKSPFEIVHLQQNNHQKSSQFNITLLVNTT